MLEVQVQGSDMYVRGGAEVNQSQVLKFAQMKWHNSQGLLVQNIAIVIVTDRSKK